MKHFDSSPATSSNNMEQEEEVTWASAASAIGASLLAGGAAGAIAKTIIAPLDRTKILFQVHGSEKPFSLRAMRHEVRRIVNEEGVRNLWKGNTAAMVRVLPYAGLQYAAFDQYSRLVLRSRVKREYSKWEAEQEKMGASEVPREVFNRNAVSLGPIERMLCGSGAGATAVMFTYPLDLIRARLAVSTPNLVGGNNLRVCQYTGMMDCFRTMVREEGTSSLFSGIRPTLLGILPYAGLAFMSFGTLKEVTIKRRSNGDALSWWENLLCGGISGLLAQSATYPLDVVRRRMQTQRYLHGR